ncbi:MAG TPA: glycoside hydrolase family 3 N-terminal domain-containing protein [Solirubrobacteraceae bacterium]|nr:glycoside hydrolase family 3 N-terminal domain-containing protein [Solirubrobacteraceae bacterium]
MAPEPRGEPLMSLAAGRLLTVLVLIVLAVGGAAFLVSRAGTGPSRAGSGQSRAGSGAAAADAPSIPQLAGQRIVYSYAGLRPPGSLLAAIRAGEAAGVIFFADNVAGAAQLRGVVDRLQRLARAAPGHRPLLMLTDQEGGAVRRLPGPPVDSERTIGDSPDGSRRAAAAGAAAARTLRATGVNVNLAPVLGVYRQTGNFIDQYGRAYSAHAGVAGRLGAAFIAAQQRSGVAATAKHFPGLGAASTAQNTDLRPVSLATPAATLRAVDERPYRAAIAAGVKLVMVSWARYPALDAAHPAGLSARIIDGELRGRLGFRGVTVTDGIQAGGLEGFGNAGARAVAAARAGADLILCAAVGPSADSPAIGIQARSALAAAIASGEISRSAARASAARILALRAHP